MFDHAFLAAVEALRRSFDSAMLDHQSGEERLQTDLVSGDVTWEASYALPGEGKPPRVRADVTVDWPTWSQTAFRSWYVEHELEEPPELGFEIVLRVQDLAGSPDLDAVRRVLDPQGPDLGAEHLHLAPPTLEQAFDEDMSSTGWAVEFAYEGSFELNEAMLADRSLVDTAVAAVGPWVASMLVRLGDLRLAFLPQREQGI
ncbi:MAG: hypothetical protein ACYDH6_09005 [Acidimicrobiales bacterium]